MMFARHSAAARTEIVRSFATYVVAALLLTTAAFGQFWLRNQRAKTAPVLAEGALAALGGLRSLVVEIVWFRADRLQESGRYVELAQLAELLAVMEPHTPEVWSYAAWNLAYNVSVMMPSYEDRWRWVAAGIRLLRDSGLKLNPDSSELCRELAWLFELKIGANIDSAAPVYREKWKKLVEDVKSRGAWDELGMDPIEMLKIEHLTGFDDWTDPQLSAIYWAAKGRCADIVQQASAIYCRNRGKKPMQSLRESAQ